MSYPGNYYLPGVIAIPSSLTITAITNSNPMVVSVSVNPVTEANTYIPGQLVKLMIPFPYGMQQANGLTLNIINTGVGTLSLNVDSTMFDPFSIPPVGAEMPASLSPSGSRNLAYSNSTNQVGFQSLNNIGN